MACNERGWWPGVGIYKADSVLCFCELWIEQTLTYESWEKRIHPGSSWSLWRKGDVFNPSEYKNHASELFHYSVERFAPLILSIFWRVWRAEGVTFSFADHKLFIFQRCYGCGAIIFCCNAETTELWHSVRCLYWPWGITSVDHSSDKLRAIIWP